MTLPIERSSDTPLRPRDIDADSALNGAFGNRDTEVTAIYLVRFCQFKGNWKPFTLDDLTDYVLDGIDLLGQPKVREGILSGLNQLEIGGYIQIHKHRVTLTTAFVARCYQKAPVLGTPRKRRRKPPRIVLTVSRYERIRGDDII